MSTLNVIIADDHPINQRLLKTMLNSLGRTVQIASDGQQLLDLLEVCDCDVIFMDLQMPGLDGFEATQSIRRRWPERPLRIIGVSAFDADDIKSKCIQAGMTDFLSKPVALEALEAILSRPSKSGLRAAPPARSAYDRNHNQRPEDLMQDLIPMVVKDATDSIGRMDSALLNKNVTEIASLAHRLRGSFLMIYQEKLAELCEAVEGGAARANLHECRLALTQLACEVERFRFRHLGEL
jgi:CheY-like chemotaxis protein